LSLRNIIAKVFEPLFTSTKKITLNGEVSFLQNKFEGNGAVGFQMLEGLQTGQNLTWRLLLQKTSLNS
jgi:hypothetical protein